MILIFAGAGASAAISEGKIPTTRKFFEQAENNPTLLAGNENYSAFATVMEYLESLKPRDKIDIEDVLIGLGELIDFLSPLFKNGERYPEWFFTQRNLINYAINNTQIQSGEVKKFISLIKGVH